MLKMVVADDERLVRESICTLFDWEMMGIEITSCCKDGLEVLDALLDTSPDIIMTDIKMPGLDGLDLIERVLHTDSRVQFIILSGFREFEFAKRAMECGVKYYLLKPISSKDILDAVRNAKRDCEARSLFREHPQGWIQQLCAEILSFSQRGEKEQACQRISGVLTNIAELESLQSYSAQILSTLHSLTNGTSVPLGAFDRIYLESEPDKLRKNLMDAIVQLLFPSMDQVTLLIDKVKQCIGVHLSEPHLSLKWIAEKHLYMNATYLCRQFNMQTGVKFSAFVNDMRIKRAKELLEYYDIGKIARVAELVGFGDNPRYFSSVFKKYTGITPTEYANAIRAK